jgi:hypothetical protein
MITFRNFKNILILFSLAGLFGASRGAEARFDSLSSSRYTSARAAAMGNSFLALSDDVASALFYNPAALARFQGPTLEPMHIQARATTDYVRGSGLAAYKLYNLDAYQETLTLLSPQIHGFGGGMVPSAAIFGFGAGILIQDDIEASVEDGELTTRASREMIPSLGYGVRLAKGIVRIGYSVQWVNRAAGERTIPLDGSEEILYRRDLLGGSAFSHNAAITTTLPYQYLPSFNLVARNIGGVQYRSFSLANISKGVAGTPDPELSQFDFGFGMQPKISGGSYASLLAEAKDLLGVSGVPIFGRLSAGAEFSLYGLFFLRAGFGRGYPSAGIGIRRNGRDFSFSWYSEEIGNGFRDERNQKFTMQYQVRAF